MMKPGAHPGLSEAEYDLIPALRSSILRELVLNTPAHARHLIDNGRAQTAEMYAGKLLHTAELEPLLWATAQPLPHGMRAPTSDAGKAKKAEFLAAHPGIVFADQSDIDRVNRWHAQLHTHPRIHRLLTAPGKNELTLVWDDPTGVRCKARLDRLVRDGDEWVELSLKTDVDPSPRKFPDKSERLGYGLQSAFYGRGILHVLGLKHVAHVSACIEKTGPCLPICFELQADALRDAQEDIEVGLRTYAQCESSGVWPGYPHETYPLERPRWATFGKPERIRGFSDEFDLEEM